MMNSLRQVKAIKKIRPSLKTYQSSAYSAINNTFISQDRIELKKSDYLHQGIVLCAVVSKAQIEIENHPRLQKNLNKDKKLLVWKKYFAMITPKGQLKLYKSCHCKNWSFHFCVLFGSTRPKHVLNLCPAEKNSLYTKNDHMHSNECTTCYTLSLDSPIDYSWSLSSRKQVFFFQSNSVRDSQHWYRSLYTCLPPRSKKPLPKTFSLNLPDIPSIINLPLSDLEPEGGQNVDLSKVRDSVLALLNQYGLRPSAWTQDTVGICWKSQQEMDWVLKPESYEDEEENKAYLIEPRLVETTHELQMGLYQGEQETRKDKYDTHGFAGYILDASKTRKLSKNNSIMYISVIDHFMFLYSINEPVKKNWFGTRKTSVSSVLSKKPLASSVKPQYALGVIDILEYKRFEETVETPPGLQYKHVLHIDNQFLFQIIQRPLHDWSKKIDFIKKAYKPGQPVIKTELVRSATLYVKPGSGRMETFKQRVCILTQDGILCLFKIGSKSKGYRKFKTSIKIRDNSDLYIYSGSECCSYINGIQLSQNSRLLKSGDIEPWNNIPKESCFVIRSKGKEHVFFANSKQQKDEWVQSICSLQEK